MCSMVEDLPRLVGTVGSILSECVCGGVYSEDYVYNAKQKFECNYVIQRSSSG